MRSPVVALMALVLVWHVAPIEAVAQRPSALAQLDTLGLESGQIGRVTYFHAAPDQARAEALAVLVENAAALFDRELDLRFDVTLAALGPDDWFSEFPGVPYAVPWASISERLLVLPSSLTEGVLLVGPTEVANRRRVDFVALHEYGHVAAKEYFRRDAAEPYVPVAWFEELLATYFAYAYVAEVDEDWAEAEHAEWEIQLRSYTPPVLSLDWRFMDALRGPELSRVYGWYQFLLNKQAAALYERHGLTLLPRLKAMLPWESAPTCAAEALLRDLDTVTPKLAEWAESFGEDGPGG